MKEETETEIETERIFVKAETAKINIEFRDFVKSKKLFDSEYETTVTIKYGHDNGKITEFIVEVPIKINIKL